MAARGSEAKAIVSKLILTMFKESFSPDSKEIRIPVIENGEEIQIKVTLTAAKTNIERDGSGEIKEKLPVAVATGDVVKCGPLTDEEKRSILEQLMGIVDVELEPIDGGQSNEQVTETSEDEVPWF